MASTKEMQARAKAYKSAKRKVNDIAQQAAQQQGYRGINMSGASGFMNSVARLSLNTPANTETRFDALARLFINEAQKNGGEQAAKEMAAILEEQRSILL